jgi:MFS superfamily sulfate permease-like transporter
MLSEKDKEFIIYWEKVRDRRKVFSVKLTSGLPMAALFCVPILLFITAIYLFFPEWYTKVSGRLPGSVTTIVVAVIICMFFFSYFRMQYKWEMNEQLYQELKNKAAKENIKQ